jgi:uncharacterized membrane protein YheB (UPF0754 family)
MNGWMILALFLSTIAGWLISRISVGLLFYPVEPKRIFGIIVQGLLPKHKSAIIKQAVEHLSTELLSQKDIHEKFLTAERVETLLPQIEIHIDDFLRHRLGKKMPMIGMFIGENTIRQLKEVFMEELKEIFPGVMASYLKDAIQQKTIAEALASKINSVRMQDLAKKFPASMTPDLRQIGYVGALAGFMFGMIQLLLIVFAGYQ